MSDESLRALERAAHETPDDLAASDRLERAQARAGNPVASPGRQLVLSQLAAKLQSYVTRALDGTSPDQMFPRRMSCQLFAACPRIASGLATIRLSYDSDVPVRRGRASPFSVEVNFEPYGRMSEERKYRTCLECFAAFRRIYVYPDATRDLGSAPPHFDGAWVTRAVAEWFYDPDNTLPYVRGRPAAPWLREDG